MKTILVALLLALTGVARAQNNYPLTPQMKDFIVDVVYLSSHTARPIFSTVPFSANGLHPLRRVDDRIFGIILDTTTVTNRVYISTFQVTIATAGSTQNYGQQYGWGPFWGGSEHYFDWGPNIQVWGWTAPDLQGSSIQVRGLSGR